MLRTRTWKIVNFTRGERTLFRLRNSNASHRICFPSSWVSGRDRRIYVVKIELQWKTAALATERNGKEDSSQR